MVEHTATYGEKKIRPAVSVITAAYNAEPFIDDTIRSVLNQTFDDWEMNIVDDASSDHTREIVEKYAKQDNRIRLFSLPENQGAGVARTVAMDNARGRYYAFLDSDDFWRPYKLEKQIAFMKKRDIAFSYTSYTQMTEDGQVFGEPVKIPRETDYKRLLKQTAIGTLTVMLDTDKTGPLKMDPIRSGQDYILYYSILKKGITAYGLPEDLALYRMVNNSLSRNKFKAARRMWRLYREYEKLSIWYAAWCFVSYGWNAYQKSKGHG